MYKIYANKKVGGYDFISTAKEEQDIEKQVNSIDRKTYRSYLIIKNDGNGDEIYKSQEFSKECKVELVDDLETDFEVNSFIFNPERLKQAEEVIRIKNEEVWYK